MPAKYRQWIIENNIRIYILPGFDIAKKATSQTELQLRMQGNSFLGAFFRVSPFLKTFGITEEQFQKVVHKQYVKKFGRFGEAVGHGERERFDAAFVCTDRVSAAAPRQPGLLR